MSDIGNFAAGFMQSFGAAEERKKRNKAINDLMEAQLKKFEGDEAAEQEATKRILMATLGEFRTTGERRPAEGGRRAVPQIENTGQDLLSMMADPTLQQDLLTTGRATPAQIQQAGALGSFEEVVNKFMADNPEGKTQELFQDPQSFLAAARAGVRPGAGQDPAMAALLGTISLQSKQFDLMAAIDEFNDSKDAEKRGVINTLEIAPSLAKNLNKLTELGLDAGAIPPRFQSAWKQVIAGAKGALGRNNADEVDFLTAMANVDALFTDLANVLATAQGFNTDAARGAIREQLGVGKDTDSPMKTRMMKAATVLRRELRKAVDITPEQRAGIEQAILQLEAFARFESEAGSGGGVPETWGGTPEEWKRLTPDEQASFPR